MALAMEPRSVDNDTRGWIMCIISGIACVVGASIICVDVIVRLFPGKRNFRISESNGFLAGSLSLSFGVMLFSALFSMLPESKDYLKKGGVADQKAGFIMMGCFIGGFFGIQAISRFLHQYIPSHVVDCDHTHQESVAPEPSPCSHGRRQSSASRARRRLSRQRSRSSTAKSASLHEPNADEQVQTTEATPLLESERNGRSIMPKRHDHGRDEMVRRPASPVRTRATPSASELLDRRRSVFQVQKRVLSFVKDTKCNCDESGSCYGFTDPCGQECFKHVHNRAVNPPRKPAMLRTTTGPFYPHSDTVPQDGHHHSHENGHAHHDHDCEHDPVSPRFRTSRATSRDLIDMHDEEAHDDSCSSLDEGDDIESQHHHHVPENAFLSIGLQTSIAIALHKFPEGFITYATNHANPDLGFSVFMALFVHNITEGFAMALPLYMAIGSRWRAMAWSALLGGLSQPMGASMAWLWFKFASRKHMSPNAVAYACLFAVTSGIMVSVALQLFVESLSLNHNRNLCILFGFIGMALLGLSNALVAQH